MAVDEPERGHALALGDDVVGHPGVGPAAPGAGEGRRVLGAWIGLRLDQGVRDPVGAHLDAPGALGRVG